MIDIFKYIAATTILIVLIMVVLVIFLTSSGMAARDITLIIDSITNVLLAWSKWTIY